jgi:hypothetical protein
MRRIPALLIVIISLVLGGCLGGAPQQRFLRIADPGITQCKDAGAQTQASEPFIIAIKTFDSMPSLDRANVLVGNGRVLAPSHGWYWEGTPAETLTMAVAEHISESGALSSAWPYRPRIERDAMLTGRVLTFAAELAEPARFRVAVKMELWNGRGREKLAEETFEVMRELPGFSSGSLGDPHDLAEAAGEAVCILGREVTTWLEGNAQRIRRE